MNERMWDSHTVDVVIALEECEKHKEWFNTNGYEPLPTNRALMINNKDHIQMRLAYTLTRDNLVWEGHMTNEFGTYYASAPTPAEHVSAIKTVAYTKMVELRRKLDIEIYLLQS